MKWLFSYAALLFFLFATAVCFGLRVNLTPSMPIGVYILTKQDPKRGDWVAVCLLKAITEEGLRRHYLAYGDCPEHSVPLLKQLIAIPGDVVQLSKMGIVVNERFYPAVQLTLDSHQHRIRYFVQSSRNGFTNHYWLYGANDFVHSWDSRYWGGIHREAILGVYQPLWVADLGDDMKSSRHSSGNTSDKKNKARTDAPSNTTVSYFN